MRLLIIIIGVLMISAFGVSCYQLGHIKGMDEGEERTINYYRQSLAYYRGLANKKNDDKEETGKL